jgi:DNA-directed RNA polymerase specialized sigma24 family protein
VAAILHWYGGYETGVVADVLGISAATVRVHLSRARRRLRTLLPEEDQR